MTEIEQRIREIARPWQIRGCSGPPETALIMAWIDYMQATYGPTCYPLPADGISGKRLHLGYDWGQALCHQQFGPAWNDEAGRDDLPNEESWRLALAWAEGEWPAWAEKPKTEAL